MLTRLLRRGVAGAAVLAVMAAGTAVGQDLESRGRIVITPYAGVFVSGGDVAEIDLAAGGTRMVAALKQQTGLALGATGSYWLNDRFSLEAGGSYVMSDAKGTVALNDPTGHFFGGQAQTAHLWMGTAKLMMNLMPSTSEFRLRLGAGPAVINRGGPAYKSDDEVKISGLTDWGGAVSLCTRIPITGALGLRLRGESYLYESRLKVIDRSDPTGGYLFGKKFQTDFVFSAGLQFAFNR